MSNKIKQLTKNHWKFNQFLKSETPDLLAFLDEHAPLWEAIYHHAYTGKAVTELNTEDGLKVNMIPYRLWEMMFRPKLDLLRSVYMLCCMGLLGIEEEDFCKRKEWIFYSLPQDFQLIEWYCKLLNGGIIKSGGKEKSFKWIKINLENGCTSHKMVCGNGRSDSITVGNPRKLARIII